MSVRRTLHKPEPVELEGPGRYSAVARCEEWSVDCGISSAKRITAGDERGVLVTFPCMTRRCWTGNYCAWGTVVLSPISMRIGTEAGRSGMAYPW